MQNLSSMITSFLSVIISVFLLSSCAENEGNPLDHNTSEITINKIMPLGASRVQGARPNFESYRYELWKDLVDGGWTFDFIGTVDDDASYPTYNDLTFDEDHEGRGGWTSGQILLNINDWLEEAGSPDIVLFSSPGGNDALMGLPYESALSNINKIVDALQENNPNVTIIIEQMAPGRSALMSNGLNQYFLQMQKDVLELANAQTTSTSKVISVDMFTGFTDDMLADNVHYNEDGARFIADRYYSVLEDILVKK